jgi:hypothetical protein
MRLVIQDILNVFDIEIGARRPDLCYNKILDMITRVNHTKSLILHIIDITIP